MDSNIIAREWLNGAWFVMSAFLWSTIGLALLKRVRRAGFMNTIRAAWNSNSRNTREIGLQMGIGFFIYLTASVGRAGYIWLLLLLDDSKYGWAELTSEKFKGDYSFMIATALVAYWGAVCTTRVFIQDEWSPWRVRWSWIIMGLTAVSVPVALHWVVK